MEYKKTIILLALVVFLLSIAGVSASEIDNTIASENANTIELFTDNDMEDNLQTSEENEALASTDYDEAIAQTDTEVLGADSATYSDLAVEIRHSGNITLTYKNYTYNGGATITIGEDNKVIDGNGAVIDMNGSTIRAFHVNASGVTIKNLTIKNANYNGDGGAIYFSSSGTVSNCNFNNNTATENGGAIRMSSGTVSNCNFSGNKATGEWNNGGAIFFVNTGNVTNCNFADNSANRGGGAVRMLSGSVSNCNFTGNTASNNGGAVYFSSTGNVTNCNFVDNSASRGGAILSQQWWAVTADTCIFKTGSDTTFNTHNLPPTLNVNNFTTFYNSGEKLTFDLKTNSSIPVTNGNISISVYFKDGDWVGNYSCLSGEGWIPNLPCGSYYAIFDTEYAEFQPINRTIRIIPNIKFYANVTSAETNNRTVNITAKSNIPQDILEGKLLFIFPGGENVTANYSGNGIWWAEYTFEDYDVYQVSGEYIGLDGVTVNNGDITITKADSTLTVGNIVFEYKSTGSTPISFTGASGITAYVINHPEAVVKVSDNKITVSGLNPGTYVLNVTTIADDDHNPVTKTVNITVNKIKTQITAVAKTFKTTDKTKTYLVALKDSKGRAITNAIVYLKVNGVTYKATTNSKGVAAFKISKLIKQGTYEATITYNGNAGYNKATKTVQITVKSVFKTVSKGSKDKATVKKIQAALKKNGYYLKAYGHYLKVDGIFHKYTELAVKQFQKAKGLKVTGKVDETTAKKLKII